MKDVNIIPVSSTRKKKTKKKMALSSAANANATGTERRKRNMIKNQGKVASVLLAVIVIVCCNIFFNRSNFETIVDIMQRSYDIDIGNSTTSTSTSTVVNEKVIPQLERLIQPGNHVNIPSAESRIGPNGEEGYVQNPKFLVENPPPFQLHLSEDSGDDEEELSEEAKRDTKLCVRPGQGFEHEESAPILQNIRRNIEKRKEISKGISKSKRSSDDPTLFCAIYTYSANVEKTTAISETWGPRCDGILYASDVSNATTGHMHIPSNSRRGFSYTSIFQRIRAILVYLYDNFLNDYEFFHVCGDDTYVIVENLKEFLSSERVREWDSVRGGDDDEERFMMAGFWTHWQKFFPEGEFYLAGGSGYTLSRKALKGYVEGPLQKCHAFDDASMEDIYFARCVREFLTLKFIDTRDEFGAHRYHMYNVYMHSAWPSEEVQFGIKMDRVVKQSLEHMEAEFGFPFVVRDKYVSNSSVAFHYHNPTTLRRMEMLLYRDIEDDCGDKMEL